jgi:hypothetical protein
MESLLYLIVKVTGDEMMGYQIRWQTKLAGQPTVTGRAPPERGKYTQAVGIGKGLENGRQAFRYLSICDVSCNHPLSFWPQSRRQANAHAAWGG